MPSTAAHLDDSVEAGAPSPPRRLRPQRQRTKRQYTDMVRNDSDDEEEEEAEDDDDELDDDSDGSDGSSSEGGSGSEEEEEEDAEDSDYGTAPRKRQRAVSSSRRRGRRDAAASTQQGGRGRAKSRRNLPRSAIAHLKEWLLSPQHVNYPYPTEEEKEKLARKAGLTLKQLTNWFTNARKRLWAPLMRQQGKNIVSVNNKSQVVDAAASKTSKRATTSRGTKRSHKRKANRFGAGLKRQRVPTSTTTTTTTVTAAAAATNRGRAERHRIVLAATNGSLGDDNDFDRTHSHGGAGGAASTGTARTQHHQHSSTSSSSSNSVSGTAAPNSPARTSDWARHSSASLVDTPDTSCSAGAATPATDTPTGSSVAVGAAASTGRTPTASFRSVSRDGVELVTYHASDLPARLRIAAARRRRRHSTGAGGNAATDIMLFLAKSDTMPPALASPSANVPTFMRMHDRRAGGRAGGRSAVHNTPTPGSLRRHLVYGLSAAAHSTAGLGITDALTAAGAASAGSLLSFQPAQHPVSGRMFESSADVLLACSSSYAPTTGYPQGTHTGALSSFLHQLQCS